MPIGKDRNLKPISTPNWVKVNDEDNSNAKFLNHELAIMQYANKNIVDITDIDSVRDACSFYMQECAIADLKPNVIGLCATLRLNKRAFYEIVNGKSRTSPEVRDILQQMVTMMEYQLNLAITDSKQNPVGSIFLLKNHHQYTDKTEFSVESKQSDIEELSDNELREKYMGNVIIPEDE